MDLEKAKNEFIKYTQKYDLNNENIKRKQLHSIRVMEISKEIAKRKGLEKEQIELAQIIGLLHDIARFEQMTQYSTFDDLSSFDHGDYGAEILKKDIRKYLETSKYDEIIFKAIKNHNKFEIEKGLNEEELLYAKLIRDADKIDIIYEGTEVFWPYKEDRKAMSTSKISDKVYEDVINCKQVKIEKNEKYIYKDGMLCIIALIYDINFRESFRIWC